MRALTWLRQSFAVRSPERLGQLLAWSTGVGLFAFWLAGAVDPRSTYLPAALASVGIFVTVPRMRFGVRVVVGLTLVGLVLGLGGELPSLLFVPAMLWLVLAVDGELTPARALSFAAGSVLATLWHAGLVHVLHPWNPATHLLLSALKASVGLFLGVGLAAAHVEAVSDRIAGRLEGRRAGEVWRRVQQALSRLPRGDGRRRLEAQVRALVLELLSRLDEERAVAESIAVVDASHVRAELEVLASRAEAATDAGARAHLEQAMRVHRDTLEQVDGLVRQRERLEARAATGVALLERAALCLEVAPASASLADVASRLEALSSRA
jgi:hypothetical protein